MRKKAKKKNKMRIIRPHKKPLPDPFSTFVKRFVYGIIVLNSAALLIGALLGSTDWLYGSLIGIAASFFYLWALAEQRKRVLWLVEKQRTDKTPRGFVVRYSIMIVFLFFSGMISIVSLLSTFISLFMIRFILYYIAYKERHD